MHAYTHVHISAQVPSETRENRSIWSYGVTGSYKLSNVGIKLSYSAKEVYAQKHSLLEY